MKEEFKILSLHQEKQLSDRELEKYFESLRRNLENRKLTNTTPGARFLGPRLKKVTNKIADALTRMLGDKDVVITSEGQCNIPDGAVLFAHTHQGLLDNFAWIPTCPRHSMIFHSAKVKTYLKLGQMNTGLVLVDKDDKTSRINAKLDTIQLLLEGYSVSIWPESTWLLSPNKLHLPMNYGFLDIAKKTGVPIVPVVSRYFFDTSNEKGRIPKIHISYGAPICVGTKDSLEEKLEQYTEQVSTMRWNIIENEGTHRRADVSNTDYINYLKANLNAIKMGGADINVEHRNLWGYSNDFYRFFHINEIPFDENGNLLETEEVRRLKAIDLKNKVNMILRNMR